MIINLIVLQSKPYTQPVCNTHRSMLSSLSLLAHKSIRSLQLVSSQYSTLQSAAASRLSVCVVGSGPAGFYTVDKVPVVYIIVPVPVPLQRATRETAPDALIVCWLQLLKRYGDNVSIDVLVSGSEGTSGHGQFLTGKAPRLSLSPKQLQPSHTPEILTVNL